MQDFEFPVENGRLQILQTRNAKRTPWAALKIAVDMVREKRITPAEALRRLDGLLLDKIERLRISPRAEAVLLATAVPASLGVATGEIVFCSKRAVERRGQGRKVILIREDIATEDIEGLAAADGVLTATGGRTSHAAVVARQLGKVCLVGCTSLRIDPSQEHCMLGQEHLREGENVTLDGDQGRIYRGQLSVIHERPEYELVEVTAWRRQPS
jgi:pyruvate,orthophosphate dikinase